MHSGFTIYLAKTDKEVDVPAGMSILEALTADGVEVESMCQEGICGTCEVTVLSGEVDHRDFVLSAAEQAAGKMQVCVSLPKEGEKLVLDL